MLILQEYVSFGRFVHSSRRFCCSTRRMPRESLFAIWLCPMAHASLVLPSRVQVVASLGRSGLFLEKNYYLQAAINMNLSCRCFSLRHVVLAHSRLHLPMVRCRSVHAG